MAGRGLPWPLSCVGVLGEGCCFELRQSSRGSRFNGAVRRRCLDSALRLDGSRFHVCSDVSAGSDARFKGCTRAEQKGQCAIASACAQTQNREWCATCGAYERRFRLHAGGATTPHDAVVLVPRAISPVRAHNKAVHLSNSGNIKFRSPFSLESGWTLA